MSAVLENLSAELEKVEAVIPDLKGEVGRWDPWTRLRMLHEMGETGFSGPWGWGGASLHVGPPCLLLRILSSGTCARPLTALSREPRLYVLVEWFGAVLF